MNKKTLQYQQEMHHLVKRFKQSGLSLREYSTSEGVSYEKLRYWKNKFKSSNHKLSTNVTQSCPDFISISVPNNQNDFTGLQLTYPNQVKITCPSGMSLPTLETLIKLY